MEESTHPLQSSDEDFVVRWTGPSGDEEGPLYVLWQLIESYKVDIFDIALHRITEDFLQFVERAGGLRMELASSFALMASRLVYYKSKALLPDPGFEEPEGESRLPPELIEQLLEYRRFQLAADAFREMDDLASWMLARPEGTAVPTIVEPGEEVLDVVDLVEAYVRVVQRLEKRNEPEHFMEIVGEPLAVEDRMDAIRRTLGTAEGMDFLDLFAGEVMSRMLIVVTVLAILELARLREIVIAQSAVFGPIQVFRRSAVLM